MHVSGGVPPARWIVNYDFDLLDGLVLGAVLGAHMPFLVTHTVPLMNVFMRLNIKGIHLLLYVFVLL